MKAATRELVQQLSFTLKTPKSKVIDQAVSRMAIAFGVAGVAVDWNKEAERRGYLKKRHFVR